MREQQFLAELPETVTPWDLMPLNDTIIAVHKDHRPRIMYANGTVSIFCDPAHEQRMCKSKRGFSRKKLAKIAVKSARRGALLKIYKCWYCAGWHTTKKRKKRDD